MARKKEISVLIIGGAILIAAYFYLDTSNSLFGMIVEPITPVDWTEVYPREIVKNSIPIILLESNGNSCMVYAEKFESIINHQYFVRSEELSNKLRYDSEEKTIIVNCDKLHGEKSRLHVWYVLEESPMHPTKYDYYITSWNTTEITP